MNHSTIIGALWAFSTLTWLAAAIFQFMAKNHLVACPNIALMAISVGIFWISQSNK